VTQGQIFGEMTAITQLPRSATAVAKRDCTVIALDDKHSGRTREATRRSR
jgi:CRP-like cAMP-binding protein